MPNPARDDEKRGLALLSLGAFLFFCQLDHTELIFHLPDSGRFESLNGLSQLFILREILRTYEFDNELEPDTAKVYEVFDLIVGTGSGGLVACLVGPLEMTVEEAIQAYLIIHTSVFFPGEGNVPVEERTSRLKNVLRTLIEERLSPEEQTSGFSEFNKLTPGCMIVTTALSKANVQYPTAFRSFRGRRGGPPPCNLLETTLSTLAHSHLFSSVSLKQGSITHQFIAADLGHCNPLDTLVSEMKDQFKNRSIALIVSIGTGRPSHISLEGDSGFARAASELAVRCNDISDRFEKMLHGHSGAFVRLNADGYEMSPSLSPEDVSAHTDAYMDKAEVAEKLEVVVEGLKERPSLVKVSEISFPKVGSVETLRRDIQNIPQRASTFDAVNRLPYAERATFNPDMGCYPGTRIHLLSVIYEWMEQNTYKQPILWVKGLFGTGKSALSHSVAREASTQKVLASAFFMTPGAASRDVLSPRSQSMNMPSIENLVTTLLRDLSGISRSFRDAIGAELEASPRLMTASPIEQLEQLFYPFLAQLPRDRIFLWVIDGFDEIIRQDREGFSGRDILESLVQHGRTLSHSNFIIFVTSRPFENHPFERFAGEHILPLALDLAAPENAEDMDTIAYSELRKIEQQRSVFKCPLRDSAAALAFRDKAAGLPLWLKIVRNFLMQSIDPNKALFDLVKPDFGPVGYKQRINETYASVISAQIDLTDQDNQRYLNDVVVVLLSLQRPVSRPVLSDLINGAEDLPSTVLHGVLKALHPLLLGLDNDNPVEFIHLSLRDFFQNSPTFGDLIQHVPAPRDFASGHHFLLARSIHTMQSKLEDAQIVYETEGGSSPNDTDHTGISEALLYSASAWTYHITQNPSKKDDKLDGLDAFLAGNFTKWLEFHIHFGSFLFSSQFMSSIQSIHGGHYDRLSSAIKYQPVAHALEKISKRLLDSRRFQEAASAASQAVLSWRLQPTTVETNSRLAGSLGALASAQHELRQPAALTASEESFHIYSILAAEQPAKFNRHLAIALSHMSRNLFHAGLHLDALRASQRSAELYRKLAAERPVVYNSDLALALNNLSIRFTAAGKREEAFEASQQSVELYRELAAERPAVFNGDLARALTNMSSRFSVAGMRKEALEASQQSVELYHGLAAERPAIFNDDLARTLGNLSICFTAAGKREEAFEASQQSAELYRKLAAERPAVFNGDLALALNNLSIRFTAAGKREEAFEASQQSVELYRELAAERPAVFNGDLANALNNLSVDLSEAGKSEKAVEASQQSVELYRELAAERPAIFNEVLASALNTFSYRCYECNRFMDAHELSHSSLILLRADRNPSRKWAGRMARCLAHFATVAWLLQHHVMAMDSLEESITLYDGLSDDQPWEYQSELTTARGLLAGWKGEVLDICLRQKRDINGGTGLVRRMPFV